MFCWGNAENLLNQAKFGLEPEEYTKAINHFPEVFTYSEEDKKFFCEAYYGRAQAYFSHERYALALKDFIHALKKNCGLNFTNSAGDNLFTDISNTLLQFNSNFTFSHDLAKLDKSDVFETLKILYFTEEFSQLAMDLLKTCFDETKPLGKLMWRQRWFTPCALHKGTLKDICDFVKENDKTFEIPQPSKKHYNPFLFCANQDRKTFTKENHIIYYQLPRY